MPRKRKKRDPNETTTIGLSATGPDRMSKLQRQTSAIAKLNIIAENDGFDAVKHHLREKIKQTYV